MRSQVNRLITVQAERKWVECSLHIKTQMSTAV